MKVAHPVMKMAVCAVVGATALAACSKSSNNNNATPTWIMPVTPGANGSVYTAYSFQYQMWRPTNFFPSGSSQTENKALSVANDPVWSNSDKTVTIKYKNWTWSDGKPVTSTDAEFFIDLTRAAVGISAADYSQYTKGVGIPDQVVSMSTPDSHTLVINLNKSVNPT